MKLTERKKMILIHIAWILALAVILWPLFTIAKYDYPSADDWSFGKYMYRAMQAGEGIAGVFHAIYQTLAQNVWEARFSILILSALQPAAFGEHFYRITPYLMIGSVILSQFLLLRECIAGQAKENRWLILPIGIPMAILQVLYCPYPEESFYWYNGSVNYTFVYSLSLVLLTLYLEIALRETGKAKRVVLTVLACLLAILVGGNNFSTSVFTMCLLICLQIVFLIFPPDLDRDTVRDTQRIDVCDFSADSHQTQRQFWRQHSQFPVDGHLAVPGENFSEYYQLDESEGPAVTGSADPFLLESGQKNEL